MTATAACIDQKYSDHKQSRTVLLALPCSCIDHDGNPSNKENAMNTNASDDAIESAGKSVSDSGAELSAESGDLRARNKYCCEK